jgi:hypothetical protein
MERVSIAITYQIRIREVLVSVTAVIQDILTKVFRDFPQSIQENVTILIRLSHD